MKHQLRNGAILSYIQTALNILVVIAFTPLLTHSLGQQEYGLYALVMAYGGYLSLLDMGLSNVIIRYISRNRITGDEKKEADLNGFFFDTICWYHAFFPVHWLWTLFTYIKRIRPYIITC